MLRASGIFGDSSIDFLIRNITRFVLFFARFKWIFQERRGRSFSLLISRLMAPSGK